MNVCRLRFMPVARSSVWPGDAPIWVAPFNSAAPIIQDSDTIAATCKLARYRLLSFPVYALECLLRLAREMDAESKTADK
jgi:hypothetical protein